MEWIFIHSPLFYLTQSIWRDEVYSILMASKPIGYFVSHLSFEPPFYYLLFHFWIKLFGTSEIMGRALSLVGLTGATIIVAHWAQTLFPKHWLRWWLPVFFFCNPMLLYYGMEIRTYGWYIFFATLSLYTYAQKKWPLWIVATTLGFYTHSFVVIVPFAQAIHSILTKQFNKKTMYSFLMFGLCIFPWLIKIGLQLGQLKSSWYFPVDFNLIRSVLGNIFIGYEGTPWYLWAYTRYLSIGIIIASIAAWIPKKTRSLVTLFIVQLYAPLIGIIGISFIKPLFVNRYVIATTIAEVFLIAYAIAAIRNSAIQKVTAALILLVVILFNYWYPDKHPKTDFRNTFAQIQSLKSKSDVIIAEDPLVILEALYYGKTTPVYMYNPQHNAFPWYVGEGLVSKEQMVDRFPPYPIRAFFVHQNGSFDIVYNAPL